MTTLHHEITIKAPVGKVWRVLSDLKEVAQYNPLVANAKYTSEAKEGIGASRHCNFTDKGFSDERVIEWERERILGLEIVKSSWPLAFCRWSTKLAPEGDATRVSQELEYEVKFGVLGKLMNALFMRRKFNSVLETMFQNMGAYIEQKI